MIYFCDYTKNALEAMKKYSLKNEDIQEVFNHGFTIAQNRKFLDKDGLRTSIQYQYDGYTLRYVIISIFKRKLKVNI